MIAKPEWQHNYVFESEHLFVDLLELNIQKVCDLLLFFKILVKRATFGLVQSIENAALVQAIILLAHEFKVGLAIGLQRQVVVLHFCQKLLDLALILLDELFDGDLEIVVESFDLGEVGLDH